MMTFLLLVGVMLLLLGGITGIVLFIIGLVKQKPSMWGSGIVLGVLTLLLFAGGLVALWNYLFVPVPSPQMRIPVYDSNASSTASVPWDPNSELAAIDLQAAKEYFQDRVGVVLPGHVSVVRRQNFMFFPSGGGPGKDTCLLKLSIPADFETFLAANFTKARWADVEAIFQAAAEFKIEFLPNAARLQTMSLHIARITKPGSTDSPPEITVAAYDANTHEAWLVDMQRMIPDTQEANQPAKGPKP